jgi:hypothetical protein
MEHVPGWEAHGAGELAARVAVVLRAHMAGPGPHVPAKSDLYMYKKYTHVSKRHFTMESIEKVGQFHAKYVEHT